MIEERRDSSIFVLGILIAAALAFYGLWTEGNPTVIEIVELVKNRSVEYLEAETITRINEEVVYLTATPRADVNDIIYSTPVVADVSPRASINEVIYSTPAEQNTAPSREQVAVAAGDEVAARLRAITPIVPTPVPSATNTMVPPPPPSTMPPMPPTEVPAPTIVPATEVPAPTQIPPTVVPPTVPPSPTQVPPTEVPAPTQIPPTVPPPPTQVPPTAPPPPTQVPPTVPPPPTQVPPTVPPPPTQVPPTVPPPPTQVPPTQIPNPQPTLKPITPVVQALAPPKLVEENPEQIAASSGMATLQGQIDFIDESSLTLILTNGDYYNGFDVASDGEFWFENVPNGSYHLSIAGKSGCGQITVSVPEGHRTLTYNYRFYKMQCALIP